MVACGATRLIRSSALAIPLDREPDAPASLSLRDRARTVSWMGFLASGVRYWPRRVFARAWRIRSYLPQSSEGIPAQASGPHFHRLECNKLAATFSI